MYAVITGTEINDSDELLVSWELINFQPSLSNFHVHFFFNIYEPEQVGSNSESFGVPQGNQPSDNMWLGGSMAIGNQRDACPRRATTNRSATAGAGHDAGW